ncbi:MAG: carotenoid oxygenase family protein [Leptolyngbyaceae bacterium]|nr:carotenoid oxygenase family protein [Leptolyngbyaceae bacterium]
MTATTPTTALSYKPEDWQQGYRSQPNEYDYWIDDIEGVIPPELTGTLFRNGPGLLEIHGQPLHHPFDGDGMVCAIAFRNGRAHFRNRFVRTEEYLAEQKAGKMLYRGVFGTQKPGGWLANIFDIHLKNVANTQVIYWGGKLLALWEGAKPYRLNPHTLETIGIDTLDGILQSGTPLAAHPWIDPACVVDNGAPCLVNFSVEQGLSSKITIYELNPQGTVLRQKSHNVPGFCFLHDCAITPNYIIFFQNPVTYNPLPFVFGLKAAGQCMQTRLDQPTKVIVIPRHRSAPMLTLDAPSGFIFHHVNAFEQDGQIRVDSIRYDQLLTAVEQDHFLQTDFDQVPPGRLTRFSLDLAQQQVEQTLLDCRPCEFPTVHPNYVGRPHRYVYVATTHHPTDNAPLQAIAKVDMEDLTGQSLIQQIWSAAPRGFVGEPVFVPHPHGQKEDEGWVLTLVFNAARGHSELIILDAQNLNHGPVAVLRLKHHIPYGLHGTFTEVDFGPTDG